MNDVKKKENYTLQAAESKILRRYKLTEDRVDR